MNHTQYTVSKDLSILLLFLCFGLSTLAQENRSIDGTNNHMSDLGAAQAPLAPKTTPSFSDGFSTPAGITRPSPRVISNAIFDQESRIDNQLNLSDYVWAFGQFLDHDISLVENGNELERLAIPANDEFFIGGGDIPMFRSLPVAGTGTDVNNPRTYSNSITSFIDASQIYGSDLQRAEWLRDPQSNIGELKLSDGALLPWNTITGEIDGATSDPSIPAMDPSLYGNKHFVAGDVRANENPLLIGLHTIFVREHNRICVATAEKNPSWDGDKIYEYARKHIGAYIQAIAFYEWMPSMGIKLPDYAGYRASVDPGVFNVFSAAAFRIGHTMINSSVVRMDNEGEELQMGNVDLKDAYFNPTIINVVGGIEPYMKGMATNIQQEMDCKMIDDLRNFLFGQPGAGGLDLAAINIHRGRERGLPDYNTVRTNFGLPRINSFLGITGNAFSAFDIEQIYGDVDDIDVWVGLLSEQHVDGAIFGELTMTIIRQQFQNLRDGDRFYFENDSAFSSEEIEQIKQTSLHDIIMRNTNIELMQDNVFEAMPHNAIPHGPELLPLQLEAAAYPNPFIDNTIVKFYLEVEEEVSLTLYNGNGAFLHKTVVNGLVGENFVNMDFAEEMPRGIYNIKVESDLGFKVLRIIKK